MSLSKKLKTDPLNQIDDGYHADYIGSKSISDLPTEILMNILSYVSTFPLRFNLCCVNHQWNKFIHKYFKNIGVVNIQKYAKMDKFRFDDRRCSSLSRGRNIREQMKNIVGFWKHKLDGLEFNGTVDDFISGMKQLLAVLRMCAGQNTFQVIRFELKSPAVKINRKNEQLMHNLISMIRSNFPGLKELKWHCDVYRKHDNTLDLSQWTSLRSLDSKAYLISQLPPSITSLKLELRSPYKHFAVINFLNVLSDQLESVDLHVCWKAVFHNENFEDDIIQMPRLKYLHIAMDDIWDPQELEWRSSHFDGHFCSFDLSRSAQLESLLIKVHINYLEIIGVDFTKHRNLSTFCITSPSESTQYDLMACSFADAELNKLKSFTLNCSSNIAVDFLRRLSLGCSQIREIDLRINELKIMDEYSSLVPIIMRNCPNLEKLSLSNFGIADRDIVDLIVDTYSMDKFVLVQICVFQTNPKVLTNQLLDSLSDCNVKSKLVVEFDKACSVDLNSTDNDVMQLVDQLLSDFNIELKFNTKWHRQLMPPSKRMVSSVLRNGLFNGKVAIVTGGGTGIGLAITQELLHLGADVVIAARNAARVEKIAKELNEKLTDSNSVHGLPCNIKNEAEVKSLFQKTIDRFGRVDMLINNGGGQFASPAAKISPNGFKAVMDTNLFGTFLMCREAFNSYMKEHGGSIINITVGNVNGFPMMAHSGAARAGVDNLTKTLAIEWARYGIRINSIQPGTIWSETAAANYPPNMLQQAIPFIPANRLGNTEEISGMVCFLCSPASRFTSGAVIPIDGGEKIFGHAQASHFDKDYKPMPEYSWDNESDVKSKL